MREQLIDLYAKHEASAAKASAGYESLRAQYGGNTEFDWLRNQLEEMKTRVEERIDPAKSNQEQLREAISMLREYRGASELQALKRDLFYDLLVAIYQAQWNSQRMAYLKKALSAVRLRNDYFLSFTTRHSSHVKVNPINTRYYYFIKKIFQSSFDNANRDENLFAAAVNEIFSQKADGYYFPKSEDDTSIVIDEIRRELEESMVFVQIVQLQLFKYISGTNYCFLEWGWANERFSGEETRLIYISGEDDREWLDILAPDATYSPWYSHVKRKKIPPTPSHSTFDDGKIDQTVKYFETILKHDIVGAWVRLEKEAP
jgi:hypothetical protein